MKNFSLLIFLIGFSFIYGQQPYYNDVDLTKTKTDLFEELSNKVTGTHINFLSYTPGIWEASKQTDLDPQDPNNVVLIYGFENGSDTNIDNDRTRDKDNNGGDAGEWNREHTYPRSLGNPNLGSEGPGSDAHHLRPSDIVRNANRGNRKFADGIGNSGITSQGFWYPGDEWKGDVARMMMYMYLRYGDRCLPENVAEGNRNNFDNNMIDLFLEWNAEDPVSIFEDNRNTYHDSDATYAQGNRNPFIDNPYLATLIWGGTPAQDRWNLGVEDNEAPTIPENLMIVEVGANEVTLSWDASEDNISVFKYNIYVNEEIVTTSGTTTVTVSNLNENTEHTFSITAADVAGNTSERSEQISATTRFEEISIINENFEDCTTASETFITYSETSDKDWFCSDTDGKNDSGAYSINGFRQDEPSRDWLITKNSIDMSEAIQPEVSFFLRYRFGDTPLEFLYSTNYQGQGNPADFEWTTVPNVTLPSDFSGTEQTATIENEDISEIQDASVYFAFKYYSTEEPTRYFLDDFRISGNNILSISSPNETFLKPVVIYPNPADSLVSIHTSEKVKKLIIFNTQGKIVYSKFNVQKGNFTLPTLPSGLYFVKVLVNNQEIQQKFIVK